MDKVIIVDIQPAYGKFIDFNMDDFTAWLNGDNFDELYCLYNGPDLGYEDDDYKIRNWYWEWGLSDDVELRFFEKSYGWFRDFMGTVDDEDIIAIGKYMIEHDIWDSRDFSEEAIKMLEDRNINIDYLGTENRVMYIPELKDYLSNNIYEGDKIITCGGGVSECYKEVTLLLDMLDLRYEEKIKFIY